MSDVQILCAHPMTALWLRDIIESARPGVRVSDCESAESLLGVVDDGCDVVVLDAAACDAPATANAVRDRSTRTTIIVLADATRTDEAARAAAQGAHAVLSTTPHEAGLRAALALVWPPAQAGQVPSAAGRGGLSARELAILSAMADGMSNADIGARLFVSADTVKTQAKRLFARLGVHDRAAAVAAGLRRRLIV